MPCLLKRHPQVADPIGLALLRLAKTFQETKIRLIASLTVAIHLIESILTGPIYFLKLWELEPQPQLLLVQLVEQPWPLRAWRLASWQIAS